MSDDGFGKDRDRINDGGAVARIPASTAIVDTIPILAEAVITHVLPS